MNKKAKDFLAYVHSDMPRHNKDVAQQATQQRFNLTKARSVYFCDDFAVRFCYSKNGAFANVVLSLATLQKYDDRPFFVILVVANSDNVLYLANSTLLNKISHSSQRQSKDCVRGSFLGSNIIKNYKGIPNDASNAEQLFTIHRANSWEKNLERLVEATSGITPTKTKFRPDGEQTARIFDSVKRTKDFLASEEYDRLLADLSERVWNNLSSIQAAARIDNVNIRGRLIEYLITSGDTEMMNNLDDLEQRLPQYETHNGLGDYVCTYGSFQTYTDIKTKIMQLDSCPKGYNIDKFLETMSKDHTVFLIFLVGIDDKGEISCLLCPVYDRRLIHSTAFQSHWAGRDTRGAVQFEGKALAEILQEQPYNASNINEKESKVFLEKMLAL